MEVEALSIPDVLLITPKVFGDARGSFMESWNRQSFIKAGLHLDFVQDNHSRSKQGVLRGLHYQIHQPQGKLVRVVNGAVFDVAVDLRRSSLCFGKWVGKILSAENHRMLWVPPGFAHGFYVLSESADFLYKTTEFYVPEAERCLIWCDPAIGIKWPIVSSTKPIVAPKDITGSLLKMAEVYNEL